MEKVFINCDASKDGVGYVTYQIKEDGKKSVIHIGSRALKENQKRWSANELEALAVAYAADQSKFFITNHPGEIKIFTDNSTICGMFRKDITEIENSRISKLFETITHFNIKLEHTSGKTNTIADALSRATTTVQNDLPDVDAPEPGDTVRRVARTTRSSPLSSACMFGTVHMLLFFVSCLSSLRPSTMNLGNLGTGNLGTQ